MLMNSDGKGLYMKYLITLLSGKNEELASFNKTNQLFM